MSKASWKKRVTSRNDLVGGQLYVRAYISYTGHPRWDVYKICGKANKHIAQGLLGISTMPIWKLTVENQAKARASQHPKTAPNTTTALTLGWRIVMMNRPQCSSSVAGLSPNLNG